MKNITLSADEKLIEAARKRARAEHTTLNEQFRRWLADYAQRKQRADEAMAVVERLRGYVRTGGRKFTRDEMNER
jgi:chromosomal replication initiation ATPase DnaA